MVHNEKDNKGIKIMKKIIILTLMILIVPIVYSLQQCDSPIEPSDIPCEVVSTYLFDDGCAATTIKIFDSVPTLLDTRNYDVWGTGGRCNITFNFTARDSYSLNSSDGSTATIIVGGVKMEFLRLTIFGLFFLIDLVLIGFMHKFKEDEGSSIVFGWIATAIMFILGSMIMFGFKVIDVDVMFGFNANTLIGIVCYMIGFYSAYYSVLMNRSRKPQEERGY